MIGAVHPAAVRSANLRYVVVPTRSIQLRRTPRSETAHWGPLVFSAAGDTTRWTVTVQSVGLRRSHDRLVTAGATARRVRNMFRIRMTVSAQHTIVKMIWIALVVEGVLVSMARLMVRDKGLSEAGCGVRC